MKYYIWLCEQSSWLTRSGTGSSDSRKAQTFTREAAIQYCQSRMVDGYFHAIPVQVFDIEEMLG